MFILSFLSPGDCLKILSHTMDSASASSGSPPTHLLIGGNGNNAYHHPSVPMNQLREMLTTSDTEHSSDHHDHHHDDHDDHDSRHDDHDDLHSHQDDDDVKDLSLRASNVGHDLAQQAPVITSTATAIHLVSDSASNHDFDSSVSRSSSVHLHDHSSQSPPPRSSSEESRSGRLRKLSDTSTTCHHDIEHNTVNSYKFKNYIQQRFSQDNHLHDDLSSVVTNASSSHKSPSSSPINDALLVPNKKPKLCLDDDYEHSSCDGENKPIVAGIIGGDCKPDVSSFPMFKAVAATAVVQPSVMLPGGGGAAASVATSQSVPVFALHSQGRYYVPLSVDYEALVPYLGNIDLLETKPFGGSSASSGVIASIPPLHSININVNFATPANGGRFKGTASGGMAAAHLLAAGGNGGVVGAPVVATQPRSSVGGLKNVNINCW